MKALLIIVNFWVFVGCLPPNQSLLKEDQASVAQMQELATIFQDKTGIASKLAGQEILSLEVYNKCKEIFTGLEFPPKDIFIGLGQATLSVNGDVVNLTTLKLQEQKISEKVNLHLNLNKLTAQRDVAKLKQDLEFLARLASEFKAVHANLSAANFNFDVEFDLQDLADQNFSGDRPARILAEFKARSTTLSEVIKSVVAAALAPQTMFVFHLNLEGTFKQGMHYQSGFAVMNSILPHPLFHIDMAKLADFNNFLGEIKKMHAIRPQIEAKVATAFVSGQKFHLSFGKTLRSESQMQALITDQEWIERLKALSKHSNAQNLFWIDEFSAEPLVAKVTPEGVFVSAQIKDQPLYAPYLGGFFAMVEADEQGFNLVGSFPNSVKSFKISSFKDPAKILAESATDFRHELARFDRVLLKTSAKLTSDTIGDYLIMANFADGLEFRSRITVSK